MAQINQVAEGIYRISSFSPSVDMSLKQTMYSVASALCSAQRWRKSERLPGTNSNTSSGFDRPPSKRDK